MDQYKADKIKNIIANLPNKANDNSKSSDINIENYVIDTSQIFIVNSYNKFLLPTVLILILLAVGIVFFS